MMSRIRSTSSRSCASNGDDLERPRPQHRVAELAHVRERRLAARARLGGLLGASSFDALRGLSSSRPSAKVYGAVAAPRSLRVDVDADRDLAVQRARDRLADRGDRGAARSPP